MDDREGNPFEYRWVAIIGGGDQQCGDSGGDELPDLFCIPLSGFAVGGQHELSAVVADAVIDALHNVGKKAVGDFRQNQAQRDWFLKRAPGLPEFRLISQLFRSRENSLLTFQRNTVWFLIQH